MTALQQIADDIQKLNRQYQWQYLQQQIEHQGIYRSQPSATIPAKQQGQTYTWQFYLRRCLYDPAFAATAADLLVSKLSSTDVQIAACEDAGVVLAMAMSVRLNRPMFSIKKTPKAYGLQNWTEGPILGLPVLLVDDLAGSQATLRKNQQLLQRMNMPMATEYAVLVNKTQNTHDVYLDDMKLISLFTCEDFKLTWNDYVNEYKRAPEFGRCF